MPEQTLDHLRPATPQTSPAPAGRRWQRVVSRLTQRVRHTEAYVAAHDIRSRLRRYLKEAPLRRVVSLRPDGPARGEVLLSYRIQSFLANQPRKIHQSHWMSQQMAKTFLELGYAVDVVNDKNASFVPRKAYDVCIDGRWNLERFRAALGERCLHIMHADTAHILYHNAAEARRLLDLQQRRGVVLRPRRYEPPTLALEHADCGVLHGNAFTLGTYRYAGKPLYTIPTPAVGVFPFPEQKDFAASRHRFVFLASNGMVHKGLDLALEAFAGLPDHHLVVCGPVRKEPDFEAAYRTLLYETPNITTVGWMDVNSPRFAEIASGSVALLYPSCSEGQAGAVTTCMQAGLIPIASYQSGVDLDDFGLTLTDCTIEEIRHTVRHVASLPGERLAAMSRRAWACARANYTREAFARRYREVIVEILASRRAGA